MNVHLIATEGTNWITTWAHPSLTDAVNTAMSLDHMVAEMFATIIFDVLFALLLWRPAQRWWNRWHSRHDAEAHPHNATFFSDVYDLSDDTPFVDFDMLVFGG